jgi:hypothetical protein
MNIKSIGELEKLILSVVEVPDEVYMDLFNVKYFLKKINELYINIIIADDRVKIAYLISPKTYLDREKNGRNVSTRPEC